MNNNFPIYTTDYISGTLSLRKPQERSLEILDDILNHVTPSNSLEIEFALEKVNKLYPTCTDFERDFISLALHSLQVLANKAYGAFISYLYTNHGIKTFS